jgi:hypothetical protein
MTISQFKTVKDFCIEKNITHVPNDVIMFISKAKGIDPNRVRDICCKLSTMGFFQDNGGR